MPGDRYRVQVESVHWPTLLPSLRLFESFRLAIHPSKLALAFLLVLLLCLGGWALDLIVGPRVFEGDMRRYYALSPTDYRNWRAVHEDLGDGVGPFKGATEAELGAFRQMVASALSLDFGFGALVGGGNLRTGGVIGALVAMVFAIPVWLAATQPLFFWLFLAYAFLLTALFGGAISRLAALQASRDERIGMLEGLRFAASRYVWFVLAPLIPLLLAGAFAILLVLAGLVFFNLPGLDVIGALLMGPLLLVGLIITLLVVGLIFGIHVVTPAIAVEGTDAFDALSRAYNFVLGRPFRFAFYVILAVVFFSVAYLLLSLLLYGAINTTQTLVGAGAFREVAPSVERFAGIMPDPQLNAATEPPAWDQLDATGTVSAHIASWWVRLALMLLPAFAVSFYFSAATWVYLLLRRAADGVEFEEVYEESDAPPLAPDTAAAEETTPTTGSTESTTTPAPTEPQA